MNTLDAIATDRIGPVPFLPPTMIAAALALAVVTLLGLTLAARWALHRAGEVWA